MSHPYLAAHFPVRWSTLTPEAVEADITTALDKAQKALADVVAQDRGRLTFESVMLDYEEALRELNEGWGLVTHLDAVCNSPALREAHIAMLP
jgi:oligopeptidase A